MKYGNVVEGTFISRPNRFVANVKIDGRQEVAHVKNTGRCRELLIPGAKIYLEDFSERMGSRKLKYSLIAVEKERETGPLLINMDSQAPNKIVGEALESGELVPVGMGKIVKIRPEAVFGNSRLDFFVVDENGKEGYIEVKGVTLEDHGVASFPDAPTERGIKHLKELSKIAVGGRNAYVLFLIQMEGMEEFRPNDKTHMAFGDALRSAQKEGVNILAYDCGVQTDSLVIGKAVKICLV